jgi:hypothetical protein
VPSTKLGYDTQQSARINLWLKQENEDWADKDEKTREQATEPKYFNVR